LPPNPIIGLLSILGVRTKRHARIHEHGWNRYNHTKEQITTFLKIGNRSGFGVAGRRCKFRQLEFLDLSSTLLSSDLNTVTTLKWQMLIKILNNIQVRTVDELGTEQRTDGDGYETDITMITEA
jgi:hypothetical protein